MPKIEVWKCPHSGKLFEDEKRYRNHLKTLSRARIARRKYLEIRNSVNEVIAGAQNVASVQELVDYIIAHQTEFMIFGVFNDSFDSRKLHEAMEKGHKIYFPKIKSLKIDTKWRPEVSNSHSCPRDGYTNWGGHNKDGRDLRSYPGWHGRIDMSLAENDRHIVITPAKGKAVKFEAPTLSDMGKKLNGINTGSGGGGLTHNSYDVSLFQSDFPRMSEIVVWTFLKEDGEKANWGSGRTYKSLNELGFGEYGTEKKDG